MLGVRLVYVDILRCRSVNALGALRLKMFFNMLIFILEARCVPGVCFIRFE